MNKTITAIIALVVIGLAFYGGMVYGRGQRAQRMGQFAFVGGQGMGIGRNGTGMGFIGGQIISKDAQSVTVSVRGGGSKIIFTGNQTAVQKSVSGSLNDLQVGQEVTITGTPNSDGSFIAQNIQIRPASSTPIRNF